MDLKLIKQLREQTGAGIADCKEALSQSKGNMEKAKQVLREKGFEKGAKKWGVWTFLGWTNFREKVGPDFLGVCSSKPPTSKFQPRAFLGPYPQVTPPQGVTCREGGGN